jgi:hypothetical protein
MHRGFNFSHIQLQNRQRSPLTARQLQKQSRRQAHALRLEHARLGQQTAHAFASARFIQVHQKDLVPAPDYWHQLNATQNETGSKEQKTLNSNHFKKRRLSN